MTFGQKPNRLPERYLGVEKEMSWVNIVMQSKLWCGENITEQDVGKDGKEYVQTRDSGKNGYNEYYSGARFVLESETSRYLVVVRHETNWGPGGDTCFAYPYIVRKEDSKSVSLRRVALVTGGTFLEISSVTETGDRLMFRFRGHSDNEFTAEDFDGEVTIGSEDKWK